MGVIFLLQNFFWVSHSSRETETKVNPRSVWFRGWNSSQATESHRRDRNCAIKKEKERLHSFIADVYKSLKCCCPIKKDWTCSVQPHRVGYRLGRAPQSMLKMTCWRLKTKLLCVLSGFLFQERACKMLFTVYDILLNLKLHAVFMAKLNNLPIMVMPQWKSYAWDSLLFPVSSNGYLELFNT